MGVPPEKVADVMALMGDSIDNIPGAKGIGEKGARELIRRFGSAETALDRATEVEGKRYREALLQQPRRRCCSPSSLPRSTPTAPVKLVLDDLRAREPDVEALRALYAELGFTSLLRDLPAAATAAPPRRATTPRSNRPDALRKYLAALPRESETRCVAHAGRRRTRNRGLRRARRRAWKFRRRPACRAPRGATPKGEMLAALSEFLRDPARPKIVHDPKLIELLAGPVAGIRHADHAVFLSPAPDHGEARLGRRSSLRQLNVTLSGAAGEHADHLQRLAPLLRKEVEAQGLLRNSTKRSICRSPRCWPRWSATACASIPPRSHAMSDDDGNAKSARSKRRIWELAGSEFNINSPAATRRNSVRQDESRARRQTQPRQSRAPPPPTCSRNWRWRTNCRATSSNTASSPS